jgi:hypothetical protein
VASARRGLNSTVRGELRLVSVSLTAPDWVEILTGGDLRCKNRGGKFKVRASRDGALWTKFGTNSPRTGDWSILPDGSGWKRSIEGFGTASQAIVRVGEKIKIDGETSVSTCKLRK